ncbi:MAG: hypothetical protein NZV14_00155 [Bryobacteraceae bacterium]|nr:hypothetical protein [Bryobacteraceae bacterium]MDW8376543.1 hypothetical protein [Bryobacterales bacterium]
MSLKTSSVVLTWALIFGNFSYAATILHVRANTSQPLDFGLLKQGTLLQTQGTATNGAIGSMYSGLFSLQISPNSSFLPFQNIFAFCAEPVQPISSSNLPNTFFNGTLSDAGLNPVQQTRLMTLWHHAFAIASADSSPRAARLFEPQHSSGWSGTLLWTSRLTAGCWM